MATCFKCNVILTSNETALYRKLVLRSAETFLCIDCLAEHFQVDRALLEEKIDYFKRIGCALF
ncbi:hypothetical protein D4S03_01775 [bacterium]|nr:MAG: hypothetical protein D4S03_01775 [bacterium]